MGPSRIQAVDDVYREAGLHLTEALRWFYGEVGGIEEIIETGNVLQLCFKSSQVRLRIRLVERPIIEPYGWPLVLAVPSLTDAAEKLKENGHPIEWFHGFDGVDRRLATCDPAGNRVLLKREWPYGML